MANATGIRRSEETVRANHGLAEVNGDGLTCSRERCEQLIATAALEMDRLYERICESGCVLLLTDSDGAILHEKSSAMLRGAFRVSRIGSAASRSLSQERDVALATYRASQHALTLEDLAGERVALLDLSAPDEPFDAAVVATAQGWWGTRGASRSVSPPVASARTALTDDASTSRSRCRQSLQASGPGADCPVRASLASIIPGPGPRSRLSWTARLREEGGC